jgi:LPXTG-motif cell wall-anchored protein
VQCGISIRRDHNGGATDLTYDSFSPITFASPTEPTQPTVPPTEPTVPSEPAEPGAGTLDWGVKASFRNYVLHGPAAGAIDAGPPATENADGTYRFPAGSPVSFGGPDDVVAQFVGAVRFTGHHGALDLSLSEPRVEIDAGGGTLVVDASSKDMDTGVVTELDDIVIADLDVDVAPPTAVGHVVTFADVPATLTEEGAEAFGGFYVAGDPLDPVTFAIEVDDPGALPPPTEQVAGCVPDTVTAGQLVTVCGDGFVPGEQVQVFLHSEPTFVGVAVAGPDGSVTASVVIPSDTTPGLHRLELRGVTSSKSLFSLEFTVTAAAALARTGDEALPPAAIGGLLLVAGAVLVRRSRRALETA